MSVRTPRLDRKLALLVLKASTTMTRIRPRLVMTLTLRVEQATTCRMMHMHARLALLALLIWMGGQALHARRVQRGGSLDRRAQLVLSVLRAESTTTQMHLRRV